MGGGARAGLNEGIVAKDPESHYVPGWLKIKQKDYRKEVRGFYRE